MPRKLMLGLMLGLILVPAGILLWKLGWRLDTRYEQAMSARSEWPTTQGTVSASSLFHDDDGEPIILVSFTYQVNGARYAVSRKWDVIWPDHESLYAPGASVTVYYDPANPQDGVVAPRAPEYNLARYVLGFMLAAGMALPVVGIGMIIVVMLQAPRAIRRHKSTHGQQPLGFPRHRSHPGNLDRGRQGRE